MSSVRSDGESLLGRCGKIPRAVLYDVTTDTPFASGDDVSDLTIERSSLQEGHKLVVEAGSPIPDSRSRFANRR